MDHCFTMNAAFMSSLLSHSNLNGKPSAWKVAACQGYQDSLQDGRLSLSPSPSASLLENRDNDKTNFTEFCGLQNKLQEQYPAYDSPKVIVGIC